MTWRQLSICLTVWTTVVVPTEVLAGKRDFPTDLPECRRVVLFIIDGLAVEAPQRIDMPRLQQLAKRGCRYNQMHLPLPAHPRDNPSYPWSCSLPNPMLMAGTPFVGLSDIRQSMIQHQFRPEETAFIVNAFSYRDVSHGFGTYISKPHKPDAESVDQAFMVIAETNPRFLRIHLQRPGIEGEKVAKPRYANEPFANNIWHPASPYRAACTAADAQLGRFVDWMQDQQLMRETTLLICGDHGQAKQGWHEPFAPGSSKTPLILVGPSVRQGIIFDDCEIFDLAPTIAALTGRESPKYAIGRVLREAFSVDVPPPPKPLVAQLNSDLRSYTQLTPKQAARLRELDFMTIDDVANWHSGVDSSATINRHILREAWERFVHKQHKLIEHLVKDES